MLGTQWQNKYAWASIGRSVWSWSQWIRAALTTPIIITANVDVTFDKLITAASVTNVGDGSGTFEVYNDTGAAWVAGALSTADNLTFTFNPTANLTLASDYTVHLSRTITGSTSGWHYEGTNFTFTVT